jgi:hypothetical protein
MPLKRQATANGKCKAKTKAGRPCAAPAARGGAFCSLHADPERAAALGRKGGARNRKVYDADVCNVSVPESAGDVKRMLAEAMADTRAGKIDPKLGSTLGYLGMSLLRVFEVAELDTAMGMRVYIGTTSGGETLQGSTIGAASYLQTVALVTGAAFPTTNSTICKLIANDAM